MRASSIDTSELARIRRPQSGFGIVAGSLGRGLLLWVVYHVVLTQLGLPE